MGDVFVKPVEPHDKPHHTVGLFRSVLSGVVSMVTPVAAIGAAWMYFTGSGYQNYILSFFGLPHGIFDRGIQQTMVDGYQALLTASGVPLLLAISSIIIVTGYRVFRGKPIIPYNSGPIGNIKIILSFIYLLIFFIASGWLLAFMAAINDYSVIFNKTRAGCASCFLYNTTKGRVVGIALGQDKDTLVIITRYGAAVLPANSIKAVRPINKRKAAPGWAYPASLISV